MSLTGPVIFIKTLFRSGGTYWFSKLQSNDKCLCYIEPLHENYGQWTRKDLQNLSQPEATKKLRHPSLQKDAFATCPITEAWFQNFHEKFDYRKNFYLSMESSDDLLICLCK